MDKKILFFDIDGTILFKDWYLPIFVARSIKKAQKAGCLVVINTGRKRNELPKVLLRNIKWDGFCCKGSYIEFGGKVLENAMYSREDLQGILNVVDKYKAPSIYIGNSEHHLYEGNTNDTSASIMEHYDDYQIDKIATHGAGTPELLNELSQYASVFDMQDYLDVFVKGFGKDVCMKKLCEYLNIPRENVYAFGDNTNDFDALKWAGNAVVMRSAPDSVKAIATYVGKSHLYGVCEGIDKLILKKK